MAGKLTTILAKKEAEIYCAHGLHREALSLYKSLLASCPNMDHAFKHPIENQMAAIEAQLQGEHPDEQLRLSAKDIVRLKEGWGPTATESDLMVCAQAFYRIGHFDSAMSELGKLLEKGCAAKAIMALLADCLVELCLPQQLLETLGRFAQPIFPRPEPRLGFMLLLTEKMATQKQCAHAWVLYRYLQKNTSLRTRVPRRLSAIAKGLADAEKRDSSA